MQRLFAIVVAVVGGLSSTAAFAQDSNVFRMTVGSVVASTEEYQIARAADGYRVTGNLHTERPGASVDATHDETLAPDLTLVRYRLEAGGTQVIEAWRDGDNIQMRVAAGARQQTKVVPFTPSSVVIDNSVTAHLQVVLDRMAATAESPASMTFIVPQVLAAIPGTVTRGAVEAGTLGGKPIRVRKYLLRVANMIEELWADDATGRLVRVAIPMQKVEILRDGFVPAPAVEPAESGPAAFVERPIEVTTGPVRLPGLLCLPAKLGGKVPLVVLVHGSGPEDRDETVGPNKPFRDLAAGLAAAGIATLRYDKRTFALKGKLDANTLTVEEETIADAVSAVALARTLPEVDPARVFVLGHSQGATFGPFIADRAQARGAILMAPAERPFDEVIPAQMTFQLGLAGQTDAEIAGKVNEVKAGFARVRSGEAKDDEVVFGATAHYWRDMLKRDPRAALASTRIPVLLLQGGKDVQVVKADYDLALQALAAKPAGLHEAHWFANLNHLFLEVEGRPTGAEYAIAGHVPAEVIQTIATWVVKLK